MVPIHLDLNEAMNEAIRDNPTRFTREDGLPFERGATTVSASVIGTCARRIVFERDSWQTDPGYEEPLGLFDRGHADEAQLSLRLKQALLPVGIELMRTGSRQRTLVAPPLSATPDGIAVNTSKRTFTIPCDNEMITLKPGEEMVVEFKSNDPRKNMRLEPAHETQVKLQIELFHKCTKRHKPKHGLIIYVNTADHTQRLFFSVQRQPPTFISEQIDRATYLLETDDPSDAMAEGRWSGACQYCPYTLECGQAIIRHMPHDTAEQLRPEEAATLDLLLAQREIWRAKRDDYDTQSKQIEEEVKVWLHDHDVKKCKTDQYSVSWVEIKAPRFLKADAVVAGYPEIQADESLWRHGAPQTRLTIKRK